MKSRIVARDSIIPIAVIRPGGAVRATLTLVEYGRSMAVLKEMSSTRPAFRMLFGGALARREANAYSRLTKSAGFPRFHGRVDKTGILIEYIPGKNLTAVPTNSLEDKFFVELEKILSCLTDCSILHVDLKNNIIVNDHGLPFIVDFQASCTVPQWTGPLGAWVLKLAALHYRREVARLRVRFGATPRSKEELAVARNRIPFENLWRVWRGLYRFTVRLLLFIVARARHERP